MKSVNNLIIPKVSGIGVEIEGAELRLFDDSLEA